MWLRLIVIFTCLALSAPSFALGTDQHVLGTVMAIDARHVEVKTSKGLVDVQVNNKTRYTEQHNPKGTNMPEVGDRVIVIATKKDKKDAKKGDPQLLAIEIHFSTAKRVPIPIVPVPVE